MRIDSPSLIAAQSAFQSQQPQKAVPAPLQGADKALFEPLNFPKAEPEPAPSRAGGQAAPRRPGAQLDITV